MSRPPRFDVSILGTLTPLGKSLARAATAEGVMAEVADAVSTLVAPDGLASALLADDGDPRAIKYRGDAEADTHDPLLRLAAAGPLLIGSGVREGLAVRNITVPRAPGSWIGCPVGVERPLGVVSLAATEVGRFGADDLAYVEAVTTQAAIALANIQLLTLLSVGKREWEQTVDAIRLGICVVTAGGTVLRANRAFATMVAHPLIGIAGTACVGLVPPAWADAVQAALDARGTAGPVELTAGHRAFAMSAIQVSEDRTVALLFEDQSERRRLQDQLIQSEKMSAIGQLIAGVAHDLNNPLASVVGFADYLIESGAADRPDLREPLRAIQQEADRAASIVRNLLSFARKQEHQRVALPVRPLLGSVLVLLKNELMAAKIEAEVRVARDVPSIGGNPNQVQQVLVNLINNAAQSIASRGTGGRILILAERWLDGAAIVIEDDGPGVPDAIANRIFEPFFTTKPEGDGTGLGLSICQGIVKEHRGRLTYGKSGLGGAAFRIELPAGHPTPDPPAAAPRETGSLRVLVIDDEPHIQHYMRATLEAWGHHVAVAPDGVQGLARAVAEPWDVIVSDLRMPEVGGREMFETLRREHPAVAARVVFSTGDTVRGDTLQFLEGLDRPYLRKPFSLAELRGVLAATARAT